MYVGVHFHLWSYVGNEEHHLHFRQSDKHIIHLSTYNSSAAQYEQMVFESRSGFYSTSQIRIQIIFNLEFYIVK